MDIRNWPMDKIMSLPDWCFGRRWPIGLQAALPGPPPEFDIAELALPETTVIWEVLVNNLTTIASSIVFTLALGDQLPATNAAFNECELVFPGIESTTGVRGAVEITERGGCSLVRLRMPVAAAGRRFVGRFVRNVAASTGGTAIIVVSSIPTEVPDWLISGHLRSP